MLFLQISWKHSHSGTELEQEVSIPQSHTGHIPFQKDKTHVMQMVSETWGFH